MGSVSATSGPDTELQVPDEILQNFGMKTSFSKDVPKLSNDKCFVRNPYPVSILGLLIQKVNVLVKSITKI